MILKIKARSLVPNLKWDPAVDEEIDENKAGLIRALEEFRLIKEETKKLKELETIFTARNRRCQVRGYFCDMVTVFAHFFKAIYRSFRRYNGVVDLFKEYDRNHGVKNKKIKKDDRLLVCGRRILMTTLKSHAGIMPYRVK